MQVYLNLWRAVAINGGHPVSAEGKDCETALRKLAHKTGINVGDLLRLYGL